MPQREENRPLTGYPLALPADGPRRRARLPRLRPLEARNADGVRRGTVRARLMLVGEQPGDQEDLVGHPSSGRLASCSTGAGRGGIARDDVYVTNVVKHFKWEPRGKRRIHKKPRASEIAACRPWLDTEIALVRPQAIVCLGATAAQALLGRSFKVTAIEGRSSNRPGAASCSRPCILRRS